MQYCSFGCACITGLFFFILDVYSVSAFSLRTFIEPNANEIALWVVLTSNLSSLVQYVCGAAAKRLINKFFVLPIKNLFDEQDDDDDVDAVEDEKYTRKSFTSTVDELYKQLEAAHVAEDCLDRYVDDYIQHEYLQVKLKPYQVKTIKWMLSRERVVKHHTNDFVEIKKRSIGPLDGSTKFFFNSKTLALTTDPKAFERVELPTGGILAEEMGMGKTIEILDLILLNPRPPQSADPSGNSTRVTKKVLKADVKCLCPHTKTADTVSCTKCFKLQHRKCVDQTDSQITPDVSYICPACWKNEQPLPVKTTFIVSPQSIKTQWKIETDNRVQSGKISVSF